MTVKNVFFIISVLYLTSCFSQHDGVQTSAQIELLAWLDSCKESKRNQVIIEIAYKASCLTEIVGRSNASYYEDIWDHGHKLCSTNFDGRLRKCVNQFVSVAKQCLTDAKKNYIDAAFNADYHVLEYLCANGRETFKEITTIDFRNCMTTERMKASYSSCLHFFTMKDFEEYGNKSIVPATHCRMVEISRHCVINAARKCGKAEIYDREY